MKKLIFLSIFFFLINCNEKKKEIVKKPVSADLKENPFNIGTAKKDYAEIFLDSLKEKNPALYFEIRDKLGEDYLQDHLDNQDNQDDQGDDNDHF